MNKPNQNKVKNKHKTWNKLITVTVINGTRKHQLQTIIHDYGTTNFETLKYYSYFIRVCILTFDT